MTDVERSTPIPVFIVVSGLPGSGKSTLASQLCSELGMPWLNKDAILEALFDSLGVGDSAWRERLSRAADEILFAVARDSNGAILDNWWHHDSSPHRLRKLDGRLIEVFCECAPELAIRRCQARTRHPGHLDQAMTEAGIAAWCQAVEETYQGPLAVGEQTLRIRTDQEPGMGELLDALRASL